MGFVLRERCFKHFRRRIHSGDFDFAFHREQCSRIFLQIGDRNDGGIFHVEPDNQFFPAQFARFEALVGKLLFAEADLLTERGPSPPLMLLDDVLSELDPDRRAILSARVRRPGGQAFLTATSPAALPDAADVLVEVAPGRASRTT